MSLMRLFIASAYCVCMVFSTPASMPGAAPVLKVVGVKGIAGTSSERAVHLDGGAFQPGVRVTVRVVEDQRAAIGRAGRRAAEVPVFGDDRADAILWRNHGIEQRFAG